MMEFTFKSSSSFTDAITFVAAHAKGSIAPIHKYLLLQIAESGVLSVQATNGGFFATRMTRMDSFNGTGSICVDAAKFNAIVHSMPVDAIATVKVCSDGNKLSGVVQAGRSRFQLVCLSADEFPQPEICNNTSRFSIQSSDLIPTLTRLNRMVPANDCRHTLNSICVELDETRAVVVASDGMRLAKGEIPISSISGDVRGRQLLIPKQQVQQIISMTKLGCELVVLFDTSRLAIICPVYGWRLQFSLLEGKYPNWQRVIPSPSGHGWADLGVDREYFISCLERAKILADGRKQTVRFQVQAGEITISSKNEGSDEGATEIVPCKMPSGLDRVSAIFNVGYLVDALRGLSGAIVNLTIDTSEQNSAVLMRSETDITALQVLAQVKA